jgi:polar amino acid transport system substrate-binding protein
MFKAYVCFLIFICSSLCSALAAQNIKVQVVTELSPPYQTMINNQVAGTSTTKVRKILSAANLTGIFNMYPWSRAFEKASKEPDTLIYSIAKTPNRLEKFHWLTPVTEFKFGLVSMANRKELMAVSIQQLAKHSIAVQRHDVAHEWMLKQGLKEGENFIITPDIEASWKLLLNNKVDFIVESPELMQSMLESFNLPVDTTKFVLPIPDLALLGYLAANKNTDRHTIQKLKAAIDNLNQDN